MPVALILRKGSSIDIVCPDGRKSVDVASQPGHQACENGSNPKTQQAVAIVAHHQRGQRLIVTESRFGAEEDGRRKAWKHHQSREQELHEGRKQRSIEHAGRSARSQCPLDQHEVRTPVSKAQYKTQPHRDADDIHGYGVRVRHGHPDPGVAHGRLQMRCKTGYAVKIMQDEEHERQQPQYDQRELNHLVVHCGRQATE